MKSILASGILLASAGTALAQSPQPQTYTLKVTGADLQVMSRALARGPYEDVAPLLSKLQSQLQAQDKPPEPAAKEPEPAAK